MKAARILPILVVLVACANHKSEAKPAAPPSSGAPSPGGPGGSGGSGAKDGAKAEPPAKVDPGKTEGGADLPGIDITGLDPSQVDALKRIADEKPSACGKGHSLRTSLKTDPGCKRSVYAARYLVRLLKSGLLGSEAEEIYDKRFTSPEMGKCDIGPEASLRGNNHAPITLCEFSDFQCPHCKLMEPILARLLEEFSGQVRLVYKNYPISKLHPEARDAAAAAVSAGNQGKFWPMHDLLFANQDHMSPAEIETYAKSLKLDMRKWKDDLASAKDRVEKEHAEGEKLDITGTPTLYINGRKYAGPVRFEEVKDWIDEELSR